MKILQIIPARCGSKGIKDKNIIDVCGKPLISYSIDLALELKKNNLVDTVLVSTDCEKIANISKYYGANVPFLRPDNISNDTAKSIEYYLKKNKDDSNFIIYDDEKKNEFIPGLFGSRTLVQKKLIKQITLATATKISLDIQEDDIIIFPSKTPHSTDQIKTNTERISISGDVVFLAKNTNSIEHLTPNFKNWKKL